MLLQCAIVVTLFSEKNRILATTRTIAIRSKKKKKKMMKAAVMTNLRTIEFQEKKIPTDIGSDKVLIKMKHVGICGSDLHYYEYGRIGSFIVKEPIILGHECAGEVVKIGKDVTHVKVGDMVALEPGYTCGKCEYCKNGEYNLCAAVVFMATPPHDGALAEYVCYPAEMTFKLSDTMDTIDGALIEPLSVGFHAANQANATIGQSALILGCGPIGLVTLLAIKARGITEIYVTDLIQSRLDLANKLGASGTILSGLTDLHQEMMKRTNGKSVDLVFETAGSVFTTQQTVNLVKRGGTIVLIGMVPDSNVQFDFCELIFKEVTIKTVFRYRHVYPKAIQAVSSGLVDPKPLITHRFKFDQTKEAFDFCLENKSSVVKVMIEF